MRIGFIISLIFALIVAIFGIQNAEVISVNFFFTKINISLALIIFISTIIGAIIVTLLGLKKEFILSRSNRELTKKAEALQNDMEICKNNSAVLITENETLSMKIETLETKNKELNDEIKMLNEK